ncbi:MAG TPA: methyltransferase, TIGR04325 family [Terriglobia bacterium]|nr:methyltransferase, TIGR04325 family [Terriglobia bacterium]
MPYGRKLLNSLSQTRGVFATFDEGWSIARKTKPAGHEDPSEIAVHLEFSKALRPSDYAVLYWLSNICTDDLSILDFGGNVGNLYYSYSTHLKAVRNLDWTVFDIPFVVEEGKRIAAERGATGLRFTNSLQDASECNVLLVSGAFHYWEKSVQAFLEQFVNLPEHVILNRTPVHDRKPSFITVQRTKACAFPCVVHNATEMVGAFGAEGYVLVDRWPALELSLRMPLFPDRTVPHYSGFYFRRREHTGVHLKSAFTGSAAF